MVVLEELVYLHLLLVHQYFMLVAAVAVCIMEEQVELVVMEAVELVVTQLLLGQQGQLI
jgi:hypothetical protein